jgi:transcriptional regulator with XRE-family HTH domain
VNVPFSVDARASWPHDVPMTDIAHAEVPAITLGWRLRISLERAGLKAEDMAVQLNVHRGTISRWMHDDVTPRPIYLREWARICRVPAEWLMGDTAPDIGKGSGRITHRLLADALAA